MRYKTQINLCNINLGNTQVVWKTPILFRSKNSYLFLLLIA